METHLELVKASQKSLKGCDALIEWRCARLLLHLVNNTARWSSSPPTL